MSLGRAQLATHHMTVLGTSIMGSKNQRKDQSSPITRHRSQAASVNISTKRRAGYMLFTEFCTQLHCPHSEGCLLFALSQPKPSLKGERSNFPSWAAPRPSPPPGPIARMADRFSFSVPIASIWILKPSPASVRQRVLQSISHVCHGWTQEQQIHLYHELAFPGLESPSKSNISG